MSTGPTPLFASDAPRVARVVPDVTGLDKQFDYLIPESLAANVQVGSVVRVPLHGRKVRAWVVAITHDSEVGDDRLVPIAQWVSHGPPPDVVALAMWAAPRWGSHRVRSLLVTASPPRLVPSLPAAHRTVTPSPRAATEIAVHRNPPNMDPLPMVIETAAAGPMLLIHPAVAATRAIAARLRRRGLTVALMPDDWAAAAAGVDVVVGGRAAAFAPVPDLATIVVLDEFDESLQDERSPTWHARDVCARRAQQVGARCVLVSPAPTIAALHLATAPPTRASISAEREGWPILEIIDRRDEAPWKRSLLTSALIRHLRASGTRMLCVMNTVGRARLLACRSCRSLQRCDRCEAAVVQRDDLSLHCSRCGTDRPLVCNVCGSGAMANVRPGVTRLREELEAAAGRPVVAVTAETDAIPDAEVYVGTEAALHRLGRVDVVAFLDIDAELLAPRYRAGEQAMALLVRGARLAGPRSGGGRLLAQTFLPDHEVLQAVLHADPDRFTVPEMQRRRSLMLPPYGAMAAVSGSGAEEAVAATGLAAASLADGTVLVRSADWDVLGEALAAAPRERGARLRIEVDPARR